MLRHVSIAVCFLVTSTILTLLVVPTFYDSIEIARDRAIAKFHHREARWNAFSAFVVTLLEAILTLLLLRVTYRLAKKLRRPRFRRLQSPEAVLSIAGFRIWRRPEVSSSQAAGTRRPTPLQSHQRRTGAT